MISLQSFRDEFSARAVRARCLCGADRPLAIRRRDRYGLPIVPSFCRRCGHVYARFRLAGDDLKRFYATTYRTLYANPRALTSDSKGLQKINWARKVMVPVLDQVKTSPRPVIVEWGASAGWNLVPFHEMGLQTVGFDFDREYVEFGRVRFGLDLRVLSGDRVSFDGVAPDLLIVNHVLEHVPDPLGLLGELADQLRPGGLIFVGLPFLENIAKWGFRDFFHIGHLHYFSLPSFARRAAIAGFDVHQTALEDGVVLLRRGTPKPALACDFRMHNAAVLMTRKAADVVAHQPLRIAAALARRLPAMSSAMRQRVGSWR